MSKRYRDIGDLCAEIRQTLREATDQELTDMAERLFAEARANTMAALSTRKKTVLRRQYEADAKLQEALSLIIKRALAER